MRPSLLLLLLLKNILIHVYKVLYKLDIIASLYTTYLHIMAGHRREAM
jgi:hypothetical protein